MFGFRSKKLLLSLTLLTACLGGAVNSTVALANDSTSYYSIRRHMPDLKFDLAYVDGQRLKHQDLLGKVVLVYFGYTYCPDVCPLTMAELAMMKAKLSPEQQDKVQVLMVSVDPHRDTPERLKEYLNAFGMGAIGVTGTPREIAAIAKRYRVAYQIEPPKNPSNPELYDVMHAEGIYVFDQKGKANFLASNSHDIDGIYERVLKLLD